MQHLLGWEFFRHDAWRFPIGVMNNYGYPVGIPLTYTDSIPLLAVFFKLFRSLLPETFQYFGLWMCLCFVLQGVFGFLLLSSRIRSVAVSVIGAILLILSPIMLFRLGGHSALGGHWIILWGLWLLLREKRASWGHWAAVLNIGLLVHPYLFFMNGGLLVADLAKQVFVDRILRLPRAGLLLFAQAVGVLFIAWVFGVFYADNVSAPGYGAFSMNLNAMVNPLGWSVLLKDLPVGEYQYEGFNYLGLGALILVVLALYELFANGSPKALLRRWWPLLSVCVMLGLVSISHVVMVNGYNIWNAPMPRWLDEHILGIIRSSGRLFWSVDYVVVVFAMFLLSKRVKKPVMIGVLVLAVLVQGYDIHGKLRELRHRFTDTAWQTSLVSEHWQDVAMAYKHVSFIPTYPSDTYGPIAYFAATHGLTLNTGYFAHFAIKGNFAHVDAQVEQLKAGTVDRDAIYIFPETHAEYLEKITLNEYTLTQLDSYVVLLPYWQERFPGVSLPAVASTP